ncbi:zinc finger MYM-type protein 1-like, partial [Aphis craccivora]
KIIISKEDDNSVLPSTSTLKIVNTVSSFNSTTFKEGIIIDYLICLQFNLIDLSSIYKRLIDIILCICIGGKPLRGHTEKTHDVHKGLFLDIVSLLRKYDSLFNEHFISGPKNCLYTSNRIHNDLISSIY